MRKILCTLGCFMILMISIVGVSTKEVWADTKDDSYTIMKGDDYYGTLYGSEYSADDASKWVTLKMGGKGFRIVNQDDKEIMVVDKDVRTKVMENICSHLGLDTNAQAKVFALPVSNFTDSCSLEVNIKDEEKKPLE